MNLWANNAWVMVLAEFRASIRWISASQVLLEAILAKI